ncbi:MAG TPA: NAD(+)/NADH kinase, partial [Cellvibrionaceae bacterium]|nr:NAD(+)/NADH kinase [Cellvibrionaceae bacterium]
MAHKGSDNLHLPDYLLANGQNLHSFKRTADFCLALGEMAKNITWWAPKGLMGGDVLQSLGIAFQSTAAEVTASSSALDTQAVVAEYCSKKVDLIVFAGGDGTAADVAQVIARLNPAQLALGIPAGVKIQSSVFAINPTAAGQLVAALVRGELLHVESAQVRDLDEVALQQGQVKSRYLGTMLVPYDGRFVQSIKQGGLVAEELIISDIAAYLKELIPSNATVVFGPGKTMADLQDAMGLPYTLLGFDVFAGSECLARDANVQELSRLLTSAAEPWVFLTVMGGQGHIIGRGNQQLSAGILKIIGRNAVHPIATKEKLASVGRGILLIDSGDRALD